MVQKKWIKWSRNGTIHLLTLLLDLKISLILIYNTKYFSNNMA